MVWRDESNFLLSLPQSMMSFSISLNPLLKVLHSSCVSLLVFIDIFYRRRIKVQPLYKGITNKFQHDFTKEDKDPMKVLYVREVPTDMYNDSCI